MENIQKRLGRVRPPRVHITYDVEIGGATEQKALPFVMGIIGDFGGTKTVVNVNFNFVNLDKDNFTAVMTAISPEVEMKLENYIEGQSKILIKLIMKNIDDFSPARIILQLNFLNDIYVSVKRLYNLYSKLEVDHLLENELTSYIALKDHYLDIGIFDEKLITEKILEETQMNVGIRADYFRDIISNFVGLSKDKTGDIFIMILSLIDDCQKQISFYMNQIIHNTDFKKIESSWNGLYYLVKESELNSSIRLRILNINADTLYSDLYRVMEFDQSMLFKKVYEEEFGTYGGAPFSCLILDNFFKRNNKDFDFLGRLSQVCAAAHVPLITSIDSSIFDLNSLKDINTPRDLAKIFDNEEMALWNSFRSREESKYVCFVLPRILGRMPYDPISNPAEDMDYFKENLNSDEELSWHNAVYYKGLIILQAQAKYGWSSAIRGVENGGKVENLPLYKYQSLFGEISWKCPTEVAITDRREKELSDLGFLALCYCKETNYAVFFGAQTANKPVIYNTIEATANAAISSRLSNMLNVSRLAHYIKAIMRDKIGQYGSKEDIQSFLNNWITEYVILNTTTDPTLLSRYPLKGAKVEVIDRPDNPGVFYAVVHVKPHSQLEGIEVSLRLVAEIPTKKN